MKTSILLFIFLLLINTGYTQKSYPDSLYWGQIPPGDSAIIFAPGIVSLNNRRETKLVFSPNGNERLIGIGESGTYKILYSNHFNGYWTIPAPASFITMSRAQEPFFSPDSQKIFLTSLSDIYVCNRTGQTWSSPVRLGSPVNTTAPEYHPTATLNGTLYFCSMRENSSGFIYRSICESGNYNSIEKLDAVINSNTNGSDGAYDPFIAPDESYIIFTSIRTGGYGNEDQYISYNRNGHWTNPKNIGSKINTNKIEYGSYVGPDNLYYFFSRPDGWDPNIAADIYWISAGFIERLKHTNFVPYLRNRIQNQTAIKDSVFSFRFSDSTFIDDDGNNTLNYSATLSSGASLPSWLSFNPATRTFSGTPAALGSISIKVIATDTANASAVCTFNLDIVNHVSIHNQGEGIINEFRLFQNYPNPFNPVTKIKFSIPKPENVSLKVFDILGKEIEELYSGKLNAGLYSVDFDSKNIPSGIYFYMLETQSFSAKKKMVVLK